MKKRRKNPKQTLRQRLGAIWRDLPPGKADFETFYKSVLKARKTFRTAGRESTKKKRAKNPAKNKRSYKRTVYKTTFIIVARKTANSPKMHYDGTHFTQRKEVKPFLTAKAASDKARDLIKKHPILRKYRITVEDSRRP